MINSTSELVIRPLRLSQDLFSGALRTRKLPAHMAHRIYYSACELNDVPASLIEIGDVDRRFEDAVLTVNIVWD